MMARNDIATAGNAQTKTPDRGARPGAHDFTAPSGAPTACAEWLERCSARQPWVVLTLGYGAVRVNRKAQAVPVRAATAHQVPAHHWSASPESG